MSYNYQLVADCTEYIYWASERERNRKENTIFGLIFGRIMGGNMGMDSNHWAF